MSNRLTQISQRFYDVLLYVYPSEQRKAYGKQMSQTFSDMCRAVERQGNSRAFVHLWVRTLSDIAISASAEHITVCRRKGLMSRLSTLVLGLVVIFSVLTGYVNLNANEVQAPMACILVFSGVAGFLQPKAAWRWGLLIGLSIPLSYFIGFAINYKVIYPPHYPITLVVLVIPALVATYFGVFFRWIITPKQQQAA